jgi:wyosine [tRNA(Phe)-imidazoG37] synthetase (radical SAM superfamily)
MSTEVEHKAASKAREAGAFRQSWETAFGYARNFLDSRFVYVVVSPRAHGLAVGVNMNPDKRCNFDCVYCEVNRDVPPRDQYLDVPVMVQELQETMQFALDGKLRELPNFQTLPDELLQLRHVVLSGDGEPTLCPNFCEAVQALVHLRALGQFPFFKLVLVTNATGLDLPNVQLGLQSLNPKDEIWAKLDGGSEEYIAKIDRPQVPLEKVLANILLVGQQRPIVIQSLFPRFTQEEPSAEEIDHFVRRLQDLQKGGARISLVQVYSAMRPTMHPDCEHLSLKSLSKIAQTVRLATGLRVEVF